MGHQQINSSTWCEYIHPGYLDYVCIYTGHAYYDQFPWPAGSTGCNMRWGCIQEAFQPGLLIKACNAILHVWQPVPFQPSRLLLPVWSWNVHELSLPWKLMSIYSIRRPSTVTWGYQLPVCLAQWYVIWSWNKIVESLMTNCDQICL